MAARLVAWAALSAAGCLILWILFHGSTEAWSLAHRDDWRLLDDLFASSTGSFVFSLQNGHRMPLVLWLFQLDHVLFSGANVLLRGLGLLAVVGSLALLFGVLRSGARPRRTVPLVGVAITAMIFVWSADVSRMLYWGIGAGPLMAAFGSLLAVGALHVAVEGRSAPNDPIPLRWLAAACGGAFLATFSFGTGVAAWAALLALALLARLPLRTGLIVGVSAAATVGVYAFALPAASGLPIEGAGEAMRTRPLEYLEFCAIFLGNLVAQVGFGLGLVEWEGRARVAFFAGTGGIALVAAVLTREFTGGRRDPERWVALSLGTLPIVASVPAAMARLPGNAPEHAMAQRFVLWSALLWIAVAKLVALGSGRNSWTRAAGGAAAVAAGMALFASLPAFDELRRGTQSELRDASLPLLLGVEHAPSAELLYPDTDVVFRVSRALRERGWNLFRDRRATFAGRHLHAVLSGSTAGSCVGGPQPPRPAGHSDRGAVASVAGWAWNQEADRPPAYVILLDPAGVVRGLGTSSARVVIQGAPPGAGWSGWIAPYVAGQEYSAYAVLSDGSVCRPAASPITGALRAAPRG